MASKVVICVIFIFDLIAFGLAVAAERRRSTGVVKPDQYDERTYCVYNSDISTWYGVGGFLFLLASQALVMAFTRCLCCGSVLKPGGSRVWAIILFFICWVTFLIAEACFLAGAARNAYHTKYRGYFSMHDLSCETLRKGVFAAGAAFTVFTLILNLFYYTCYAKAKQDRGNLLPK
uniref:Fiber protein Fb34 n=1 Tax=Picea sitchensis TaxID=3332 RepID=A9NLP2_PICSI|nr:unknown [Picea sitchensis]ABK22633.1 unknown [Picea sitchensis]ACN40982.1 unknown [Picea sitchensis]